MKTEQTTNTEVVDSTITTINLVNPRIFDNVTYDKVHLDFAGLTGMDIEKAEIQFTVENPQIASQTPLKEMSKGFLAIVAAKAAKKPVDFIRSLSAPDYAKITTTTMVFLMKGE